MSTTPSASAGLLQDLVDANHILFQQGIVDAFGHVSARHDGDAGRFLMLRNLAPGQVELADILQYDVETGEALMDEPPRLYLERYIHSEIYRQRPDVMAVVHNHSPAVLPFCIARTLGDGRVVLMRGHGCIVVAESLQVAVYRAVHTEVNARLQTQAQALGEPEFLTAGEADATQHTNEGQAARPWNLWRAQAREARTRGA